MTQRTKKIGSTGGWGARYGIRVRRRVSEIDRVKRGRSACPKCSTVTLHRVASGIYECRRCHQRFASGAYQFTAPPPITRSTRAPEAGAGTPNR